MAHHINMFISLFLIAYATIHATAYAAGNSTNLVFAVKRSTAVQDHSIAVNTFATFKCKDIDGDDWVMKTTISNSNKDKLAVYFSRGQNCINSDLSIYDRDTAINVPPSPGAAAPFPETAVTTSHQCRDPICYVSLF